MPSAFRATQKGTKAERQKMAKVTQIFKCKFLYKHI